MNLDKVWEQNRQYTSNWSWQTQDHELFWNLNERTALMAFCPPKPTNSRKIIILMNRRKTPKPTIYRRNQQPNLYLQEKNIKKYGIYKNPKTDVCEELIATRLSAEVPKNVRKKTWEKKKSVRSTHNHFSCTKVESWSGMVPLKRLSPKNLNPKTQKSQNLKRREKEWENLSYSDKTPKINTRNLNLKPRPRAATTYA